MRNLNKTDVGGSIRSLVAPSIAAAAIFAVTAETNEAVASTYGWGAPTVEAGMSSSDKHEMSPSVNTQGDRFYTQFDGLTDEHEGVYVIPNGGSQSTRLQTTLDVKSLQPGVNGDLIGIDAQANTYTFSPSAPNDWTSSINATSLTTPARMPFDGHFNGDIGVGRDASGQLLLSGPDNRGGLDFDLVLSDGHVVSTNELYYGSSIDTELGGETRVFFATGNLDGTNTMTWVYDRSTGQTEPVKAGLINPYWDSRTNSLLGAMINPANGTYDIYRIPETTPTDRDAPVLGEAIGGDGDVLSPDVLNMVSFLDAPEYAVRVRISDPSGNPVTVEDLQCVEDGTVVPLRPEFDGVELRTSLLLSDLNAGETMQLSGVAVDEAGNRTPFSFNFMMEADNIVDPSETLSVSEDQVDAFDDRVVLLEGDGVVDFTNIAEDLMVQYDGMGVSIVAEGDAPGNFSTGVVLGIGEGGVRMISLGSGSAEVRSVFVDAGTKTVRLIDAAGTEYDVLLPGETVNIPQGYVHVVEEPDTDTEETDLPVEDTDEGGNNNDTDVVWNPDNTGCDCDASGQSRVSFAAMLAAGVAMLRRRRSSKEAA